MHPDTLVEHIQKMKAATDKPWGINIPLMYPEIDKLMDIIISEGVKIVFTSAGSPKKFTGRLHEAGIKVAHVVSSSKFARKCKELSRNGGVVATVVCLTLVLAVVLSASIATNRAKQQYAGANDGSDSSTTERAEDNTDEKNDDTANGTVNTPVHKDENEGDGKPVGGEAEET